MQSKLVEQYALERWWNEHFSRYAESMCIPHKSNSVFLCINCTLAHKNYTSWAEQQGALVASNIPFGFYMKTKIVRKFRLRINDVKTHNYIVRRDSLTPHEKPNDLLDDMDI